MSINVSVQARNLGLSATLKNEALPLLLKLVEANRQGTPQMSPLDKARVGLIQVLKMRHTAPQSNRMAPGRA